MKILITGAEGFIGSHLVESLITSGHEVTSFIQYNSFGDIGNLKFVDKYKLKNCNLEFGDIRDDDKLLIVSKKKDIIIHLASLISIPHSYTSFKSFIDTNITGTLNVLRCVKKNKNLKLIHTSTSEVYGSALKIPMDESHRIFPQSPYAASKASADLLVNSFFNSYDLPIITLRPFNNFGPRQSPRAVIPSIINQLLSKKKFLNLGNLNTSRDFTYVSDTVNAFEKTLKCPKFGEVINIGSNYSIKISDIVKLCSKNLKIKKSIKKNKKKLRSNNSEVTKLYSSNLKAKNILKWKPHFEGINGFKKALSITTDWYKNNPDFYKNYSKKIV